MTLLRPLPLCISCVVLGRPQCVNGLSYSGRLLHVWLCPETLSSAGRLQRLACTRLMEYGSPLRLKCSLLCFFRAPCLCVDVFLGASVSLVGRGAFRRYVSCFSAGLADLSMLSTGSQAVVLLYTVARCPLASSVSGGSLGPEAPDVFERCQCSNCLWDCDYDHRNVSC